MELLHDKIYPHLYVPVYQSFHKDSKQMQKMHCTAFESLQCILQ